LFLRADDDAPLNVTVEGADFLDFTIIDTPGMEESMKGKV